MINIFFRVFSRILSLFFNFFNFIFQIIVFFIKIIIGVFVIIYFLLRKIFPKNKKPKFPFKKKNLAFLKKLDSRNKKDLILFLNLENTLVLVSEKKPKNNTYQIINPEKIDEPSKKLYITKRSNLQNFLKKCSKYFQIYIYSNGSKLYTEEITNLINENNLIQDFFSREDMVKINGKFYKDLSVVRKSLSKVVILDDNLDLVLQKENFFGGFGRDLGLIKFLEFVEFLEREGEGRERDVRVLLKNFLG